MARKPRWAEFVESINSDELFEAPYFDPKEYSVIGFGELRSRDKWSAPVSGDTYWVPRLFSGCYDSDSVLVANHRAFLKDFGKRAGVFEVTGGYDSFGIAIRLRNLREDIFEALSSVDDYPVYDDSELSDVECEREDEAWTSWAASDFRRGLEEFFDEGGENEDGEAIEVLSELSEDDLRRLFEDVRERANEYWSHEGPGASINVERIARHFNRRDLFPVDPNQLELELDDLELDTVAA